MAGDHYFTVSPAVPADIRQVTATLAGHEVRVSTARGVFSPDHVDDGTAVLLAKSPPPPPTGDLLDLGCGWGPLALSLALQAPEARVWAVDVNERALDLVRRNAAALGLDNVHAVRPDDVPAHTTFATLRSNPPIRVGKAELHGLLERWIPRVDSYGDVWLVVARHLGADSLERWLAATFDEGFAVQRAALARGFRVLRMGREHAGTEARGGSHGDDDDGVPARGA